MWLVRLLCLGDYALTSSALNWLCVPRVGCNVDTGTAAAAQHVTPGPPSAALPRHTGETPSPLHYTLTTQSYSWGVLC